jgi:hypothetical protein
MLVWLDDPITKAAGWVIVTVRVKLQPAASVTVQVYAPAAKPPMAKVVCAGVVFQLYV